MPSFIDLMADDVWSEMDIKSRLHAEIRSEISEFAETELSRALQGKFMGMHVLTAAERDSLTKFAAATARVALLGSHARADLLLLSEAHALEAAVSAYSFESDFQELLSGFSLAAQDLALLRGRVSLTEPEPVTEVAPVAIPGDPE